MTKTHGSERRNCLQKFFYSFTHTINHANIYFFLMNSLKTWSHSLNDINSLLLYAIPSVLLTGSFHEYVNFEKSTMKKTVL